jgi:ATP-dependent DNA helicase RecQ
MEEAIRLLNQVWGFNRFREPQLEIISSLAKGNDTIALLPTGGGKSLCYQLPALLMEGKVLVVSPLISLMQDQVKSLEVRGVMAKAIFTGMSSREIDLVLDNFVHGPLKILYVSPERLETEIFLTRFQMAKLAFVAVDEAHCISQWGHDFRPSYLNIGLLREIKPDLPFIALTATATPDIIKDISVQLNLKQANVFSKSFSRDNLVFSVIHTDDKYHELLHIVKKMQGSGIIYTRSRKACTRLSGWMEQHGFNSFYYHGGMTMQKRAENQKKWMDGQNTLMIATNAFGMGIDKSDVRFVVHMDIPPSIEEYYQEAGRAGRDGNRSYAISIISKKDMKTAEKMLEQQFPEPNDINTIFQDVCKYLKVSIGTGLDTEYFFDIALFCEKFKHNLFTVYNSIKILEKQGWLMMSEGLRTPSRILFSAHPSELREIFNEEDPRNQVIEYMLRALDGVFVEPVPISESKMSMALKMSIEKLVFILRILEREGVIEYHQSSELPKLYFLTNRPRSEFFKLDEHAYFNTRNAAYERLKEMLSYFNTNVCRQKKILEYFGEKALSCGNCDICKGSNDENFTGDDVIDVMQNIRSRNGTPLKSLIMIWPYNKRKKYKACIKYLVEEGSLRYTNEGLIFIKASQNESY